MGLGRAQKISSHDEDIIKQLRRIVARVSTLAPESRVIAFGSLARNELTAESDLDLAVIVTNSVQIEELRRQIRTGFVVSHPWPVDLLIFNEDRYKARSTFGGICFDIAVDGVELYPEWKL